MGPLVTREHRDRVASYIDGAREQGADVNARSEDGRTALSIAQANNSDAVIKVLEEAAQSGAAKQG